jgi:predicted permease
MAWYTRLLNLARGDRLSRDIDRELAFHLAELEDELVSRGMTRETARREARRRFGNVGVQTERTRGADIVGWLDTLAGDVRYAARTLGASPVYTLVAVLSLALGIGANTAIFSLVDAVMLRALPVAHPEELVLLHWNDGPDLARMPEKGSIIFTNPLWEALRDEQDAFTGLAAFGNEHFNLAPAGEERLVAGYWVNGGFFAALGVRANAGRTLGVADDQRGCPAVAAISDRLWRRELGADPAAVGKTIALDGHPVRIVGILDPRFDGLDIGRRIDIYAPFCAQAALRGEASSLDKRSTWYIRIVGRPKSGLALSAVRAKLAAISPDLFARTVPERWAAKQKSEYLGRAFGANPSLDELSWLRHEYSRALLTLMGMVVVVLLIACANVANLMLARGTARQREMAVRVALGAGRARLARQLFTESLMLALAGAALGIVLARWGSQLIVSLVRVFGEPVALDLPLDPRVLGFTIAVAVGTAILFGLGPAWRSTRVDPQAAMKAGGRGVVGTGRSRLALGRSLVVAQVALSLLLVAGAGLLVRSFRALTTQDPGFRAEGVLVVNADLHLPRSGSGAATARVSLATQERVLERLRAVPGVVNASASFTTPVSGTAWNDELVIEGFVPKTPADGLALFNQVSDGYFATMGMQLVAGRELGARDVLGAPHAAVVTEATVRKMFAGQSPIGRTFRTRVGDGLSDPVEIVGVVRDAKYQTLREDAQPTAFVSMRQDSTLGSNVTFEVRGEGAPMTLAGPVKAAFAEAAPGATLQLAVLEEQIGGSLSWERLMAMLSGFFGVVALVLAMIGLYGIMSYSVARRRNEIGIRMALGAEHTRVMRLVLGDVGRMVALGVVLGLAGTLAATRLVASMLYDVRPNDPLTIAASVVLLAGVAGAAGYLPARRAARLDPVDALRED